MPGSLPESSTTFLVLASVVFCLSLLAPVSALSTAATLTTSSTPSTDPLSTSIPKAQCSPLASVSGAAPNDELNSSLTLSLLINTNVTSTSANQAVRAQLFDETCIPLAAPGSFAANAAANASLKTDRGEVIVRRVDYAGEKTIGEGSDGTDEQRMSEDSEGGKAKGVEVSRRQVEPDVLSEFFPKPTHRAQPWIGIPKHRRSVEHEDGTADERPSVSERQVEPGVLPDFFPKPTHRAEPWIGIPRRRRSAEDEQEDSDEGTLMSKRQIEPAILSKVFPKPTHKPEPWIGIPRHRRSLEGEDENKDEDETSQRQVEPALPSKLLPHPTHRAQPWADISEHGHRSSSNDDNTDDSAISEHQPNLRLSSSSEDFGLHPSKRDEMPQHLTSDNPSRTPSDVGVRSNLGFPADLWYAKHLHAPGIVRDLFDEPKHDTPALSPRRSDPCDTACQADAGLASQKVNASDNVRANESADGNAVYFSFAGKEYIGSLSDDAPPQLCQCVEGGVDGCEQGVHCCRCVFSGEGNDAENGTGSSAMNVSETVLNGAAEAGRGGQVRSLVLGVVAFCFVLL